MRFPKEYLTALVPGIYLLAVGTLLMAVAEILSDPWNWQWCVLFGLSALSLLLGTIDIVEKWTDKRGFWDE